MSDRRQTDRRRADRRTDDRIDADAEIRFMKAGPGREVLSGQLVETSSSGIRVALESATEPGEKLLVELQTPHGPCVNLTASVTWCEQAPDGRYHAGCRLDVELSERHRRLLQQMAETAVTR